MSFDFKQLSPTTWEVRRYSASICTVWLFENCVFKRNQLIPSLTKIANYADAYDCIFLWKAPPRFRGKPDKKLWQEARNALILHILSRRS